MLAESRRPFIGAAVSLIWPLNTRFLLKKGVQGAWFPAMRGSSSLLKKRLPHVRE
jgi:hypothetical protein